jgi:hypothetical protein
MNPLDASQPLEGLGEDETKVLLVIVPESTRKRQKVDELFGWKEEERILYSLALQKNVL